MQPELIQAATANVSTFMEKGFAGFAFLLLCLLAVMVYGWFKVSREAIRVIERNTMVIEKLTDNQESTEKKLDDIYNKIISRPCIAKAERV